MSTKPNIVFVFADQWRQQATGYAGDPNVKTPHLDRFSQQSVNFDNAVSGCPVCTPYRASLMTGVYPHCHKLMVNDLPLYDKYDGPFFAECLRDAGYQTAYIGKWHIDGKGRNTYVTPERRLGFEWWKGFECTHDYQHSPYYAGNDPRPHIWKSYDADAQTDEACRYLREDIGEKPFALFLSWGPPHNPFGTAPEEFQAMYDPGDMDLSPNVPADTADSAREQLAGYYAHCSALDAAFGRLLDTIAATGLNENTIVFFTSDHGDMLGSQGAFRKQRPWAESIRVPFLVRHPDVKDARSDSTPVDAPDLMPTILSLCGVPVPQETQGTDFSETILTGAPSGIEEALLGNYVPFGEWNFKQGGRESRGLHTAQYTYIRTLEGPWLLYDNKADPSQLNNLAGDPDHADIVTKLDARLSQRLAALDDDFASGRAIIERESIPLHPNKEVAWAPSQLPEPYPD